MIYCRFNPGISGMYLWLLRFNRPKANWTCFCFVNLYWTCTQSCCYADFINMFNLVIVSSNLYQHKYYSTTWSDCRSQSLNIFSRFCSRVWTLIIEVGNSAIKFNLLAGPFRVIKCMLHLRLSFITFLLRRINHIFYKAC